MKQIKGNTFDVIFGKYKSDEVDEECHDEVWNIFNEYRHSETRKFLEDKYDQSSAKQPLLKRIKNLQSLFTDKGHLVDNAYSDPTKVGYFVKNWKFFSSFPVLLCEYNSSRNLPTDEEDDLTCNVKMKNELSPIYQASVLYTMNHPHKKEEELYDLLQKIKELINLDENNNPFADEEGLEIEGKPSSIVTELLKILFASKENIWIINNTEEVKNNMELGLYPITKKIQGRAKVLLNLFNEVLPNESKQFIKKKIEKITKDVGKLDKIKENSKYLLTEIGYTTDTL